MTLDFLAGIGSFPFRHVSHGEPDALLRLMDEERIDLALVSPLEAVMYRNVQRANEILFQRIALHRDRLIPAAVVNPAYAEAPEDAALCLGQLGARAVRLYPTYHAYTLDDARLSPVLDVVRAHHAPVCLAFRVEDERQRHWLVDPPPLRPQSVLDLLRAHPDVHFVLERPAFRELRPLLPTAAEVTNWSVEISGQFLMGPPGEGLTTVLDAVGPTRLLYATDAPLHYPRVATLRLESLALDPAAESQIRHTNAARLLRL